MIVTNIDKLTKPCEKASKNEGFAIASQLFMELEQHPSGVGLAAPQIGILKQVFVIRYRDFVSAFINPEILSRSQPFIHRNEGCLSFPETLVDTIRYNKIKVKDELAETVLEGFVATIFCHEYEHLNQKTMLDSKVPESYDKCFCGSDKKFKFCCQKKLNAENKKKSI